MSKQKSCSRSLIITDADEQLDPEDLNPFSFREFLRWKNQDQDLEQDLDKVVQLQSAAEEEEDEGGQEVSLTFDPEVRSCFFLRPSLAPQEEDRWGRSLQSAVDSMSSFCTEEDEEDEEEETRFSSKHEDQQDQQGAAAAGGENYEGDDETSIAEAVTSCRRRSSSRSSQTQIQQEENVSLRRSIRALQRRSDANELRVLELSEELVQRRCQEEKEAQDLESMVQSVEQNLHLMTKRALKAEGCVSKLKVELQQLQSENDSLKAADSEIVMTMRHNAQVASEYLNKTASHAHSSIRQLLGEAETLCLVSQLLQSIDKISIHDSES